MSCPHNNIVGDNYGETCADCGEQISGMGEFASQRSNGCLHKFVDGICIYCEGRQFHEDEIQERAAIKEKIEEEHREHAKRTI